MSTTFLLHFNGDDESTTITDESGLSWQAQGDAELDTAQKKLGSASLLITDTGDNVRTASTGSYSSGYDDFTFEAFIRLPSLPGDEACIFCPGWTSMIVCGKDFENKFYIYVASEGGGNTLEYTWAVGAVSVDTWYHVCVSRASNIWRLFWEGAVVDDYTDSVPEKAWGSSTNARLYVGNDNSGYKPFPGWIDEVRYCMGEALYTSNFTPPSAEYSLESSPYSRTVEDGFGAADVIMSNMAAEVEETVEIFDLNGFGDIFADIVEDTFGAADADEYTATLFKTNSDTVGATDTVRDFLQTLWIADTGACTDLSSNFVWKVLRDTTFIYDTPNVGWEKLVSDTAGVSDTVAKILGIPCPDVLTLTDSQENMWHGTELIAETLGFYGLAKLIRQLSEVQADGFDISDAATRQLMLKIFDYLWANDVSTGNRKSSFSIADGFALSDEATRGFSLLVDSLLSVVDVGSAIGAFAKSIAESLGLASAASFLKKCGVSLPEAMALADTVSSAGLLYNVIRETLALNVLLDLDGELWECFALNTPRFHASMYSGYNFNSFCVFNGRAFGANDAGIFELTGSTDAGNPIHTGVILKGTDFGTPNQKRMRRGYFGVSGSSPVLILETESGQRQVYSIDTKGKTVASHELKSKSWTLSIADFDALDSVKLIPVILSK